MTDWNSQSSINNPNHESPYNPTQESVESDVPVDAQGGTAQISQPSIPPVTDVPVEPTTHNQRILSRNIVSSDSRGTQTMSGQTIINNPANSKPAIITSGPQQNIIFLDPTTQIPRIIEGLLPDKSYGMWVSKPGINVLNATLAQLIFNSGQDIFKIVLSGTSTITSISGNTAINKVTHNLGFSPAVLAYVTFSGVLSPLPFSLPSSSGASANLTFQQYLYITNISSTTFDIWITSGNTTGGITYTVKWYLSQETAN